MRISNFIGSIRFRLVFTYLVLIASAFFVVSRLVLVIVEDFLIEERTRAEQQEADRIALAVEDAFSRRDAQWLFEYAKDRSQVLGGRVLLLDRSAVVQVDSASELNGASLPYREVLDVLVSGRASSRAFHSIRGRAVSESEFVLTSAPNTIVVYYTFPIVSDGELLGALLFSSSLQSVIERIAQMERQISVVFYVISAVLTAFALLLSGWLTRPIKRLTFALRQLGRQGYGEKVVIKGSSEIAVMGDVFNRMAEKLQMHERARDEFVSNVSHELKTPLASMKILAESMVYDENPDPAMVHEFFQDISSEIDRLNHIIADLLTMVRQDGAQEDFAPQKIPFDQLVNRVVNRLKPISLSKNISVTTSARPVVLEGDAQRLDQVVSNLVDNAIKYTDPGGKVTVELLQEGTEAVLRVVDTGIGIDPEAIPYLFDRFYRVDKARKRAEQSTGLGLAIVDKLVRLHKGYIEVQSEEGKGSAFILRLPLTQSHEQQD